MKKDVAIWNINSFGEFYMQICEKYAKDYKAGLVKLRNERATFAAELRAIPGLRVIPSQANYFTVELKGDLSARALTKKLLIDHDILIKDLSGKIKKDGRQFVRIAIRNRADNEKLVAALKKELV